MRKIFIALLFFSIHLPAHAIDPRLDWKTLETTHFYIHFADSYQSLAHHVADIAEQAHRDLTVKLHWEPEDKTHIVLSDQTDLPNGFAMPFPFNRTVLYLAPPDELNTLEDFDNWMELLIVHEYVHILHLDMVKGGPASLRKIFGRNVLLFPNMYQPAWLIEGLASYYETSEQQHTGRGQSTLFGTMMEAEVRAGIKPVAQANLRLRSWPMGTTYYLYGVHFFQFIEQTYGKPAIGKLIARYSDNLIPFMINSNSRRVLGKDMTELWAEFDVWLKNKYQHWREHPGQDTVSGKQITNAGYFTGPVKVADKDTVYYVKAGPFEHAALFKIDAQQKHTKVTNVHSHVRMDVNNKAGVLIAQPEYCDIYNYNLDLFVLAPGRDELKQITECGRYRSASWSSDGSQIIAVRTHHALSELHLLDQNGEFIEQLWSGDYGEIIGQPDWSPDQRHLVAAVFRMGRGWDIERFDIENKQWTEITNDSFIDANPEYEASGDSIIFSSERDGRYNIYRYEFATEQLQRLTRVDSGAFRPSQLNRDSDLYYLAYGANGYDVHQLNSQQQANEVTTLPPPEPAEPAGSHVPAVVEGITDYSPWPSISPKWWFPIIIVDEESTELGFTTSGNDALDRHSYILNATYDAENEWFAGNLSYRYIRRFAVGINRSTDILLDQNGDFAVARKEDSLYFNALFPWYKFDYRFNVLTGAVFSHEQDGRRAPGIQALGDFDDGIVGAAALFNNSQYYVRAISPNDGRDVRLVAETSDALESDYSGQVYTLDWREYLPLGGQHVLAVRYVQGYGTDQPEPFRLGGEETDLDLVDLLVPVHKAILGRREFPLRGYDEGLPQLRGRRMQLASIEYRFPIALVERGLMAPPVGVIQWSGNLFADSGAAWNEGSSPDTYYTSVGVELDAELSLFYGLNLQARLGVASGLDEQIGDNRAYFSLGASF